MRASSGGALKYFATLPLGGRNITRDITTLNVLEERAEDIKITSGNAMPRETPSALNMNGIKMSEVSNLIVARSEEIVANVVEQIKYAGLKDNDMPGGLICIGCGMNLNGMIDLLGRQTDLPVRRGQLPNYIRLEDMKTPASDILQVSSVLYSGASDSDDECLEIPKAEELPVTGEGYEDTEEREEERRKERQHKEKGSKLWGKFSKRISDMFKSDEDDSDLLE